MTRHQNNCASKSKKSDSNKTAKHLTESAHEDKEEKKCSNAKTCARCESIVTNLQNFSGAAQYSIDLMKRVLSGIARTISDINGHDDVPGETFIGKMDLEILVGKGTFNSANILNKPLNVSEKSTDILSKSSGRPRKSVSQGGTNIATDTKNCRKEKDINLGKDIPTSEEKNSLPKKKRNFPKKRKPASSIKKTNTNVCTNITEAKDRANVTEKISGMKVDLLNTNLENDTSANNKSKNNSDLPENSVHDMYQRKKYLIEEYTNNLKIIIEEMSPFQKKIKSSEEDNLPDITDVLYSLVLNFLPYKVNADIRSIIENPNKISSKEIVKIIFENSSPTFKEMTFDVGNDSDNSFEKANVFLNEKTSDTFNQLQCNDSSPIPFYAPFGIKNEAVKVLNSDYQKAFQAESATISVPITTIKNHNPPSGKTYSENENNCLHENSCKIHSGTLLENHTEYNTSVISEFFGESHRAANNEIEKVRDASADSSQPFNVTEQNESECSSTSTKFTDLNPMDNSNQEAVIFRHSCQAFKTFKEYENLHFLTNSVENTKNINLFNTAKMFSNICLEYAETLTRINIQFSEIVSDNFEDFEKKSKELQTNAHSNEYARKRYGDYLEIFQKISETYKLFREESKLSYNQYDKLLGSCIGVNHTWCDKSVESLNEYYGPLEIIKDTQSLLIECYSCILHLHSFMKLFSNIGTDAGELWIKFPPEMSNFL